VLAAVKRAFSLIINKGECTGFPDGSPFRRLAYPEEARQFESAAAPRSTPELRPFAFCSEELLMLLGSIGAILAMLAFWIATRAVRNYRLKRLHERIRQEWF
jgi:hypothetical protein